MTEHTIKIDGLSIHYLATGQEAEQKIGTSLIILHGWGVSADHWKGVLERLEAKGMMAFAPDLPGFGKSARPAYAWGLEDYAQFVERFAAALSCAHFALLGHSFGGRVGIMLARKNSEKLTKLILVDAAGVTPRDKMRLGAYKALTDAGKYIFTLPGLRFARELARKIIYWLSGTYDYYAQKGAMRETFQKVIGEDLTPYLRYIKAPTLILWGAEDRMTPISDAHILHKGIANSKLRIFEDLGHSSHVKDPQKVANAIEQFVKNPKS